MNFLQDTQRQHIREYLDTFLQQKQKEYKDISPQAEELIAKLRDFSLSGKFLRGSLICFSCELFGGEITQEVIKTAVAVELIHSSFLIHDDIMDQDTKRRGMQTIHTQYEKKGEEKLFVNPLHFGESVGICLGDLGFFLGFSLLSEVKNTKILALCSSEFAKVTVAQVQDVYNGFSKEEVNEDAILSVYLHKTGRYTFSLPLILGAIFAKQNKKICNALEKFGEYVGVLFQLKDDELGLFGDEQITGKPVGSDIREDKKTLYRQYLFSKAKREEKDTLLQIFGNKQTDNLSLVFTLLTKYQIVKDIEKLGEEFVKKAEGMIAILPDFAKEQLRSLLVYNKERRK